MANSVGRQLVSYIAPAAPATRRPADGSEPFLRPEVGFTPAWYRQHLDIDFGRQWHTDPVVRRDSLLQMRQLLDRRFPGMRIGRMAKDDGPLDLLTGAFGACVIAAIYGIPIRYGAGDWPKSEPTHLSAEQVDELEPPSLEANPFFDELREQLEWIKREHGQVRGYVNWQGVLNNAYRLRGQDLFLDLVDYPGRARHLFECVATTMIDAARRVYDFQVQTGFEVHHFTVSNCLVNMISPHAYEDLLLEHDRRISEAFGLVGIHNCAWNVDPYLSHYGQVPGVGYIDMGFSSDLAKARAAFPHARCAVMYTPMDTANKSSRQIGLDLEKIARELGPCDVVFADIERGTPDGRVIEVVQRCRRISNDYQSG
jgi:uroporphyrinogen decarboxylase-like protein